MKKHQKVLLGLMVLGLAGGIGTTLALTRNAADTSSISGGTDQAIYLNWGSETETTTANEVKDFKAKEAQYGYLVLAPKVSSTLTGKVTLTFTLSLGTNNELPGFTISVYSATTYKQSSFAEETKAAITLNSTVLTGTTSFDVSSTSGTKYYTLVYLWDGTSVSSGKTFGGSLKISQSFAATNGGAN